jgi:hypothetical protein
MNDSVTGVHCVEAVGFLKPEKKAEMLPIAACSQSGKIAQTRGSGGFHFLVRGHVEDYHV